MIQAARTIYLLAKTQNPHLIKRLCDLQVIDLAIETFDKYSKVTITGGHMEGLSRDGKIENDARCEMLIFYCKLILLEMSHDSLKQQDVIKKNGVRILETLEEFGSVGTHRFYRNYLQKHTDQFLNWPK